MSKKHAPEEKLSPPIYNDEIVVTEHRIRQIVREVIKEAMPKDGGKSEESTEVEMEEVSEESKEEKREESIKYGKMGARSMGSKPL